MARNGRRSESNGNNANVNEIEHIHTQKNPEITKFCGRLNNKRPDIESFLDSLDLHIDSLTFRQESHKLQEAKSYLDLTRGDLINFIQSPHWKSLSTYEEFKTYLRLLYSDSRGIDSVTSLSNTIRDVHASENDYQTVSGIVSKQLNALGKKVKESEWSVENKIDVDDLMIFLHQALTLSYLPKNLVEAMDQTWDKTHCIGIISQKVNKTLDKVPNIDMSRISNYKFSSNPEVAVVNQRRFGHTPKRKESQKQQSEKNVHWQASQNRRQYPHQFQARNERQTYYEPFCTYHKSYGHTIDQCYSVNGHNRSRYANSSRENSRYSSQYRDQTNFHRGQNRHTEMR